ncbi:MAG TPA: Hsp20/alpha crystallin family protein [Phycisphaerae bacterium]|nr:Hsp20/alpha crystallin family protein [Phycisphaerae bacterium]
MDIVKRRRERGEPLARLHDEINTLFGRFFEDWPFMPARGETWWPAMDVADEEDKIVIKAELPGVNADDIDISVVNNILTLSGEKKETAERKEEKYWHVERYYGSFRRDITLPATVDAEAVEADYHDGVLTVTLPKTEKAKPRKITVKT